MTYAELVDKLDTLPLDSDEYKEIKRLIAELDFQLEMLQELDEEGPNHSHLIPNVKWLSEKDFKEE